MPNDPFFVFDQAWLVLVERMLLLAALVAVGAVALLALCALACVLAQRESRPDEGAVGIRACGSPRSRSVLAPAVPRAREREG